LQQSPRRWLKNLMPLYLVEERKNSFSD
jgi:hypothetical protein